MKKLFVATAAVALAVAAQAASINWGMTANTWTMPDGSKPAKNTVVYLIDGGQWSAIEAAIAGGKTSFTASDTGIIAVGQTSNTKGYIADHTSDSDKLTAGQTYDFAYLVFGGDGKYFASSTVNKAAWLAGDEDYGEATSITFGANEFSTTGLSGGWSTGTGGGGDVPEPTSGLLLLVGGAMLALRRKQK